MSRQPSRSPQRPAAPAAQPQNSSKQQHDILLLFDRPGEPVFTVKDDNNTVFDIPTEYLTEEYRPARETLLNRIKDDISERVAVRKINVPDISSITKLGRRDSFSLFVPHHRKIAGRLINLFMGMRTYDDLLAASVYCRDRVNPYLYNYALSVAILHRPDTRNIQLPPLYENFPEKYVDGAVFKKAREMANVSDPGQRTPLDISLDFTASDADPEHKIAYWREDLGINLHHWHWHLVYPFDADMRIVNKDRRGELFYYLHQQMQARYNYERLCNGLARVTRLSNLRDPIPGAYYSKLDSLISSRTWPPRHENAVLSDLSRENDQIKVDLSDLERWRDRLLEAIAQGFYYDENGQRVPLDEMTGVDVLGNLLESSILSKNRNFYGDFHNFMHITSGLLHDPDGRHLETFSIMGDPATTMRDPLFFRLHGYIDYIFQQHKNTLPTYNTQRLEYQGIRISGLEILSAGSRNKNELHTHWEQNSVNLSRGMDFTPRGNVFVRFTHLQHKPFIYRITVDNTTNQQKVGTMRIFLAPKFDERGLPWLYNDLRLMFIELDKFQVTLNPRQNTIERKSTESSVTIPFEQTFRNLETDRPTGGSQLDAFNFCGCGWPQHMLIPMGTAAGFPSILFAMVSNIDGDRVEQSANSPKAACDDAASYCGIRDQKYPDKRSMGYPFDRLGRDGVDTLKDFMTPNMMSTDVKIIFSGRVEARNKN